MSGCKEQCICAVCTCGRHKLCKIPQNSDCHLDAHTEYGDNFAGYQGGPRVRGTAHPQQMDWKTGKFDGETSNRRDYQAFAPQPRSFHKAAVYQKPTTVFHDETTNHSDYRAWKVAPHANAHPPLKHVNTVDERDFRSTAASAYLGNQLPKGEPMAPRQGYLPSTQKFEGSTTASDAYRQWELPEKNSKRQAAYVPNPTHFDDSTTYNSNYQPKTVDRTTRQMPTYQQPTTRFEGTSTNHSDFSAPGAQTRAHDYAPRNAYNPLVDDRDWTSTMRSQYTPKALARCPAVDWIPQERERHADGHVYLSDHSHPAVSAG
ncbi:hypothetical protein HKX48_005718 [Thoreauomyces humboldtii]|nr:hypothetical protein HKX48_005718 [Thoreauomyces humboldtii]